MTKKPAHTIEKLAQMTARGFADVEGKLVGIRHDMATKTDLRESEGRLQNKIQESEERLLDAIKGIDVKREELEDLREDVRELTVRMNALEKKR